MYDVREIERIVKTKRRRIIIKFTAIALLIVLALVFAILNISRELTFSSIALMIFSFFAIYRIFDTENPAVAFSKEIKGVNLREEEYVTGKNFAPDLAFGQVKPVMPNTRANKRRPSGRRQGGVYIKLKNGNIVILSGLLKAHIDLYNEGDILLKYAGTKYPVIIGRGIVNQPCPICGEINGMTEEACAVCRLGIISEIYSGETKKNEG